MIDLVLWDIDGTLMDFKKSENEAIRKTFKDRGHILSEQDVELYSKINDSCWKRYEKGVLKREELFTKRFEEFFEITGINFDINMINESYLENLGKLFFLNEDALSVCQALEGRVRQYIVTNGHIKPQSMKINDSGLSKIVDGAFISDEIGFNKPDKKFFDVCFERIGNVEKEKTIIIGDSLSSDMKGGNNAGILCCWYNPFKEKNDTGIKIDYEIRTLKEVEEIIK